MKNWLLAKRYQTSQVYAVYRASNQQPHLYPPTVIDLLLHHFFLLYNPGLDSEASRTLNVPSVPLFDFQVPWAAPYCVPSANFNVALAR